MNSAVTNEGLFFGGSLLGSQLIAIGVTIVVAVAGTFIIVKVIGLFKKARVADREESTGLLDTARSEDVGAGKIFIYDVADAIRIRTGERGDSAI